jgi:hypothetical protein
VLENKLTLRSGAVSLVAVIAVLASTLAEGAPWGSTSTPSLESTTKKNLQITLKID